MKHKDIFKELIKQKVQAKKADGKADLQFVNSLFDILRENVKIMAKMYGSPEIDEMTLKADFELAKKEFLSVHSIDIEQSHSLTKPGFKTWLSEARKKSINWDYTNRYIDYLSKSGRSEKTVYETERSSLEIMEKLGDPKTHEAFYVKGLVVGEVQSGKTGNFNAVINRSIDCGYGLIIVLSGIMEDLRSQTQLRIEKDVIGEGTDSNGKKGAKGVGKIHRFGKLGNSEIHQVVSITSEKSDFKKGLLDSDFSINHTNVLICKKNVSTLNNLINWLHDFLEEDKQQLDIPFLILDDEADNASLNNAGKKGRNYASKINGQIRALLELFSKKSYLGYTATPFANVLQDRNEVSEKHWEVPFRDDKGERIIKKLKQVDNIFPDDFIVLLKPPSNYIGAKQIFETINPIDNDAEAKIPLLHVVNDEEHIRHFPDRVYENENGHLEGIRHFRSKDEWLEKNGPFGGYLHFNTYQEYLKVTRSSRKEDNFPRELPDSLKEAVLCFILSIAVRESRKPSMIKSELFNPHHTMLVHISRFTTWQNTARNLIKEYMEDVAAAIDNDNPLASGSIYKRLEQLWYKYYAHLVENIRDYLPAGYVDEFMSPIVFDSLRDYLPSAVEGIEVKAINSVTKDKLAYKDDQAQKVIAIGGNRLSRGFTLEGLTINYFIRNTNYSDTLLQMGRWFGYRPGYLDCCKIFTTQDSVDKFNSTTRCIEELEEEFKKMKKRGKSPESFVLRVRKHPGTLKITRPSIMKKVKEVKWSYQDQLEMTTTFDVRKEKMEKVWDSFKANLAPKFDTQRDGFLTFTTDGKELLEILQQENNFSSSEVNALSRFIELSLEHNKLMRWTVALKLTGNAKKEKGKGVLSSAETGLLTDVKLSIRRGPSDNQEYQRRSFLDKKEFMAAGKSANILSSNKDLSLLLTPSKILEAEKEFRRERKAYYMKKNKELTEEEAEQKAAKVTIPERVYRERMQEEEGLLVIYLFDSYYSFNQEVDKEDEKFRDMVEKEDYNLDIPLVGYALGFPPFDQEIGGTYVHGDYDLKLDEGEEEAEELEIEETEEVE